MKSFSNNIDKISNEVEASNQTVDDNNLSARLKRSEDVKRFSGVIRKHLRDVLVIARKRNVTSSDHDFYDFRVIKNPFN